MSKRERYLLLAIWMTATFVVAPRLHGAPDWAIGLVFALWFFGLLWMAITQFQDEDK